MDSTRLVKVPSARRVVSWSPVASCAVERIERAVGVEDQGVAAVEDGEGRERVEAGVEGAEADGGARGGCARGSGRGGCGRRARRSRAWARAWRGSWRRTAAARSASVALALAELGGEGGFEAEGRGRRGAGPGGGAAWRCGDSARLTGRRVRRWRACRSWKRAARSRRCRLVGEVLGDLVLGLGDELGGGGGRGGAQVGDEVGDGEVGFVADGGDDGKAAGMQWRGPRARC